PPRRIFSRYVVPFVLLAGFAGVTAFAFRGALVTTTDVLVTMPVRAPEKLVAQADFSNVAIGAGASVAQGRSSEHAGMNHQEPEHGATLAASADEGTAERSSKASGRGASLFQAPGWIEPLPYPIIIPSLRPGIVESVEVIEGQEITSG